MTVGTVTALELRVSVRRVLSVTRNGAAIFNGITDCGNAVRVVTSSAVGRIPVPGEAWFVSGEVRSHPKYGEQLHATRCRFELPRGHLIKRYLSDHPDFTGIGESKAQRLWDVFGERLAAILSAGDIRALEAVLSRATAGRLVEIWAQKRAEAETVDFLDAHGIDWRLSATLRRVWGDRALEMLRRNPYYLLAFAPWPSVDSAAIKLGLKHDDDRRLVGAVEAVLYERLLQAHTLTSHDMLLDLVAKRLNRAAARRAIELALAEGASCGTPEFGYQAFGAATLEAGIKQRIHSMLAGEIAVQDALFPVAVDASWARSHVARIEATQCFALNDEQRTAVLMPLQHSFSVLAGGAGVGKTTVLRAVIQLAEDRGLTVLQMALAGRAAQRMAQATGHTAMTIAKFLASARSGKLEVPSSCLLIVDEASMLDLPTLYRILKHLPDGVRMMLVGDAAQLPPIGFGLAFHRLAGNPNIPQAHLTTVHRQTASSGIPAAASAVREHRLPTFVPFVGRHDGVSFIECNLDDVMQQLRRLSRAWQGEDWQVLSAVKGGRAGVRVINESFHHDRGKGEAGVGLGPGEPVIHLLNDYERGLMNGTLGYVVAVNDDGADLVFDGERYTFTACELAGRIDLAYAISVHKAQGSQFGRVAVVVGKSRLLDHALIYTALTRGVEQVVFVGNSEAFERAVLSPPIAQSRCVAFSA